MAAETLIVIPTYNEVENIEPLIKEVLETVPQVEILVVDDSSPDGTGEVVKKIAQEDSRVHLLSRAKKEGLGRAYVAGFKWALDRGYSVICQMDSDFSHQPRHLPTFFETIKDCDVVLGSRYMPGGETEGWPLRRKLLSKGGNLYARLILGLPFSDLTGGFKCFKAHVLRAIDLDSVGAQGYAFQMEMTYRAYKLGFSIKEIPIVFPDRLRGESKLSGSIFWESLALPWRLRLKGIKGGSSSN